MSVCVCLYIMTLACRALTQNDNKSLWWDVALFCPTRKRDEKNIVSHAYPVYFRLLSFLLSMMKTNKLTLMRYISFFSIKILSLSKSYVYPIIQLKRWHSIDKFSHLFFFVYFSLHAARNIFHKLITYCLSTFHGSMNACKKKEKLVFQFIKNSFFHQIKFKFFVANCRKKNK